MLLVLVFKFFPQFSVVMFFIYDMVSDFSWQVKCQHGSKTKNDTKGIFKEVPSPTGTICPFHPISPHPLQITNYIHFWFILPVLLPTKLDRYCKYVYFRLSPSSTKGSIAYIVYILFYTKGKCSIHCRNTLLLFAFSTH